MSEEKQIAQLTRQLIEARAEAAALATHNQQLSRVIEELVLLLVHGDKPLRPDRTAKAPDFPGGQENARN